jgi:hypothetical protein
MRADGEQAYRVPGQRTRPRRAALVREMFALSDARGHARGGKRQKPAAAAQEAVWTPDAGGRRLGGIPDVVGLSRPQSHGEWKTGEDWGCIMDQTWPPTGAGTGLPTGLSG